MNHFTLKTATFVRDIETDSPCVVQKLYKISPPQTMIDSDERIEPYEYVVVSAADVPAMEGMPFTRVHETFIFPAHADGDWITSAELPGSTRGVVDHAYALNVGGWMIVAGEIGEDDGEEDTTENYS